MQPLGDHRVLVGPIAFHHFHVAGAERLAHGVRRQRHALVHLAAHAPVRGEVEKQRLAGGEVAGHPLGREGLQLQLPQRAGVIGARRGLEIRHLPAQRRGRHHAHQRGAAPHPRPSIAKHPAERPQGEAERQPRQETDGHRIHAQLIADHPEQPHRGAEHRERQHGAEGAHPRPRPRQRPTHRRHPTQQQVREREP